MLRQQLRDGATSAIQILKLKKEKNIYTFRKNIYISEKLVDHFTWVRFNKKENVMHWIFCMWPEHGRERCICKRINNVSNRNAEKAQYKNKYTLPTALSV